MPGFRKLIAVEAFNRGASGALVEAIEPQYMTKEDAAIYTAQTLINDYDGVVAWSREANPAVGEGGPTIILFQYGTVPEFE